MVRPSRLIKSLKVSHSLSNSAMTGGAWMTRGGGSLCGEAITCWCRSSFDWAVSLTNPLLLSSSFQDLLECSDISFSDLDLDPLVLELPLRLTLGVGSLEGFRHSFSKGILANLLSLYVLNLWNSSGDSCNWVVRKISSNVFFCWNISSNKSFSPENTFILTAVVKLWATSWGSNGLAVNLNSCKYVIFFTSTKAWPTSNSEKVPLATGNCGHIAFFLSLIL